MATGPFCHLFWVEKVHHYTGGGGCREVIWTKLPPDATTISPESNTQTFPLSLPFRAPAVVTFAIYPQFVLILFGPCHSLREQFVPRCVFIALYVVSLDGQEDGYKRLKTMEQMVASLTA